MGEWAVRAVVLADVVPLRQTVLGWASATIEDDHAESTEHLAVFHENTLIAVAGLVQRPWLGVPALHFFGVAGAEEWRSQGIGHAMFDAIAERAVALGCDLVWCEARETAYSFWESLGGVLVGEEFFEPLNGQRETVVAWLLTDR